MYNANIPKDNELPSSKQLIKSTAIALVIALFLLVTVILPAEYGVDLTGAGKTLGLNKMGEIKKQLANEAEQDIQQPASDRRKSAAKVIEDDLALETSPAEVTPSEIRSIQLKPGEAAEVKLSMKKGAVITYEWSVSSGHVNYDTHGDASGIKYFGYNKGKAMTADKGELQAAFDGKHGWFWRNRSNQTVTVNLSVSGDYSEIHRVL
jgi:hypothetical protein